MAAKLTAGGHFFLADYKIFGGSAMLRMGLESSIS